MLKNEVIRFDWAMKRMLRDKANFGVLEGLLTVLVGEPIKIVELLESESNQLDRFDKFNRVDIKAVNSKGEIIIFEVQNTREVYFLERILYGASKAITEHISIGEKYDQVKKVISVSILYFDLGKGTDYVYHGQNKFIGIHTHDELKITTKQHNALVTMEAGKIFPEYYLLRVNNFNEVARTPLEQWMEYLKTGNIAQDATAPGLPEARERIRLFNMSEKERRAYEEYINNIMIENDIMDSSREEGWEQGWKQGHHKGKEEKALEIAKNLKRMGLGTEEIGKVTGLAPHIIENL